MTDSLRKYLAELLGTFVLVFVGSATIVAGAGSGLDSARLVAIGIGFSFALLGALYAFAEVSGGHFNPVVSLAMVLDGRLSPRELAPYWVAQFAGAVLASLTVLVGFDQDAVAGTATVTGAAGVGTAVLFEVVASAIFVLVILQSTRSERHAGTALVAIPLTLLAAHVAFIPISGASLNTARSFGPALIGSEWSDFWVYLVGPPLGAIVGWAVYAGIVRRPAAAAEPVRATT